MTVKELIKLLHKADPEDIVMTWDPDEDGLAEVSGMLFGGNDHIVELQTDEVED